jgi:septal ring factor EnvC (AmiA/AmiB activator)
MTPLKNRPQQSKLETAATAFTQWVGSISSLIVHTILFVASFLLIVFGVDSDKVLLVLTTIVSLEAIYLAIFIQMTVNRNTQSLEEVEEDVAEIQEDIEEVEKDIDEIQKDVDEIQEDVEGVEKDIDEIQQDVDEMTEEEKEDAVEEEKTQEILGTIEQSLQKLMSDIEELRQKQK